ATPVWSPIALCKRLSRLAAVPRGETEARASFCQSPGPLELDKSRRAETRPQGYCPVHRLRRGSARRRPSCLQGLSGAGSPVPFSYLRHLIRLFFSWRVPSSAIGMSANLSWPCAEVAFSVSFVTL